MYPIRSRKYLDGARGETCKLRIVGVCTGDRATTIAAHIRDRHTGRGIKGSDISVVDGCFACHRRFDGQDGEALSREDWQFYALRGLQETLESRVAAGLLFLPQDIVKPAHERPTPPRKPADQRAKIAPRGFEPGHRPLQSRNNLRKEKI